MKGVINVGFFKKLEEVLEIRDQNYEGEIYQTTRIMGVRIVTSAFASISMYSY